MLLNELFWSDGVIAPHLSLFKLCLLIFCLDLHRLSELQEFPIDLEPYVKKLMNSRRRVMLVNNILQNAQVLESTHSCMTLHINTDFELIQQKIVLCLWNVVCHHYDTVSDASCKLVATGSLVNAVIKF